MAFGTSHERGFLVFGVSNAKYLAFDTPDDNAAKYLAFNTPDENALGFKGGRIWVYKVSRCWKFKDGLGEGGGGF